MNFNEYQEKTEETNVYSGAIDDLLFPLERAAATNPDTSISVESFRALHKVRDILNMAYVLMGYAGEVAELQNKFKKVIRGDKLYTHFTSESLGEQGDSIWYAAQLAGLTHLDFEDVAVENVKKLADRAERGVIKGDGDER